ncbi:hypothetical protein I0C86_10405 [Plantactinospora sp. S1510]|uniref:Uncharacterized protein n=1 Tax=Plantactinospora alkalitolerans TaxID=2789879 RepID=A0ABS0GT56_9ACTN|nr:FxLYD domain-containing protein [Plantactinospora alkalitolerans]MBF9129381.1 hypothetical protein [Plantactinospora alkalitolerans]
MKRSFWSSPGGVFAIIGIIVGSVVVVCVGLAIAGALMSGSAASKMDASVVSCTFTPGPLSSATVGIQVKNNGVSTRTAKVGIEYRDGSGNRIDTDTAYVRNIRPGDTARVEETTLLDAEVTSAGTCKIVDVS